MHNHRPGSPAPTAAGLTLVELLITSSLLVVVVGAVGTVLVSEISSTSRLERSIQQSDDIGRVRAQLQREIALSARLSQSSTELSNSQLSGCPISSPLVLIGPAGSWRIAYGLRSQGPNSNWRGPNQLMRCGPPYTATGLNPAGAMVQSVVADRLPNTGFSSTLTGTNNDVNLAAQISLVINDHQGNPSPTSTFLTRSEIRRLNYFLDRPDLANTTFYQDDESRHYRAGGTITGGDPSKLNLVHFSSIRDSFTLSNPCTRATCSVSGPVSTTLSNIDVLVFTDREIRLP